MMRFLLATLVALATTAMAIGGAAAAGPRYEDFAFTADGTMIVAVGPDRYTLSAWDLAAPSVRKSIKLDREIEQVVVSPNSNEVVIDAWTASELRYVAKVDLASMTLVSEFEILGSKDTPLKTPVLSRRAKNVVLVEELYRKPGRQIAFATKSGKVKSERALPKNSSGKSFFGLDETRALEVSSIGMRVYDTVKQQYTVSFKYGCETMEQQISVQADLVAVICRLTWKVPIFSLKTGKQLSKLEVTSSYESAHFFNSDGSAFINYNQNVDIFEVMDPLTGATVYSFPEPKSGYPVMASTDTILFGEHFNRRLELYTLYSNTHLATLSTD
jgi:hypothetical protein